MVKAKKIVKKATKKVVKKISKKDTLKKVSLNKNKKELCVKPKKIIAKDNSKKGVTSKFLNEKFKKEMSNLSPKIARVLSYMMIHNGITTIQAINDLGDTRLSASIFELKDKGFKIGSTWMEVTNRYGEERRIKRYFVLNQK